VQHFPQVEKAVCQFAALYGAFENRLSKTDLLPFPHFADP